MRRGERFGNGARAARDRGEGAPGYLAILLLIAAIALVVVTGGFGTMVLDGVQRGLCRLGEAGGLMEERCASLPPPERINTDPQFCISAMSAEQANMNVSYLFFNIGQGYKMVRYDSREEDLDGEVKHYVYLSFVEQADVGVNFEKAKEGKKIDLGGGLMAEYGAMYRLTPEQAEQLTDDIEEYQAEQMAIRHSGNPFSSFGIWLSHKLQGEEWPPDLPDPAIRYVEGTASGTGEGSLPIQLDRRLSAPTRYLVPNGGTVSLTQNKTITVEYWNFLRDANGGIAPATATYHTTSGSYTVGASRSGEVTGQNGRGGNAEVAGSLTWDFSNTTRILRDDRTGQLKNIRYVVTYGEEGTLGAEFGITGKDRGKGRGSTGLGYNESHSSGQLHTEVIQINFSNEAERQLGEAWLRNHGLEMPPSVVDQIFAKTSRTPGIPDNVQFASPPPPDADPFDRLVFNKAMGWKTDADTKAEAQELNAMLPLGRGLGLGISTSSTNHATQRAQILDAPLPDGRRQWIDYPDCTAAGNN